MRFAYVRFFRFSKENVSELHVGTPKTHRRSTQNQPTGVFTHPRPISAVPNYIGSSTWSLQIFLRTSTDFLPSTILTTPSDCFYEAFCLTLGLLRIVSGQAPEGSKGSSLPGQFATTG